MKIICHRGLWRKREEQNTLDSFALAFNNGFGIEIDVRQMQNQLVISHDPVSSIKLLTLEEVLELYCKLASKENFIAINIKTDGIAKNLQRTLKSFNINNYFTFDMSVPEMRIYNTYGIKYFSRASELEKEIVLLDGAMGVWLDSFETDWFSYNIFEKIINLGKTLCIVSPELHGRYHLKQWSLINNYPMKNKLMICTDKPFEAKEFLK